MNWKDWVEDNESEIKEYFKENPDFVSTKGWPRIFGEAFSFGEKNIEYLRRNKLFLERLIKISSPEISEEELRKSVEVGQEEEIRESRETQPYTREEGSPLIIPTGEDLPSTEVIRKPDPQTVETLNPVKETNPVRETTITEYLGGNTGIALIASGLISGIIPTGYEVVRDVVSYFSKPSKDDNKSTIINIRQSQTQRQAKNFFHKTIKH